MAQGAGVLLVFISEGLELQDGPPVTSYSSLTVPAMSLSLLNSEGLAHNSPSTFFFFFKPAMEQEVSKMARSQALLGAPRVKPLVLFSSGACSGSVLAK